MSDYAEAGRRPFGIRTRDESAYLTPADAGREAAKLERAAYYAFLAFVAALPFSIFASQMLLSVSGVLWLALVLRGHEHVDVPHMFWPLVAYGGATLIAAAFSVDPRVSFLDCKQILLFMIVPIAYRLLQGRRSLTAADIIITVGAISAIIGVVQFGILKHDTTQHRPQGALGLYMTYSGQLMLIACAAMARILFRKNDRIWASLVMPALIVALAATLSRNAWVGACAGIGLLLVIRDFRLVALLPVLAAVFIALAPAPVSDRLYSMFRLKEVWRSTQTTGATVSSNQDRIAMLRSGLRIIEDNPLTGVGPDMVIQVYPHYRDPLAVNQLNPHLHNVPMQIAAERGLPALAIWLWFVVALIRDLARRWRTTAVPSLPAAAMASVVAMVAAGMFEYNFGDSEFLMLFLVIVTLPFAAERATAAVPNGPNASRQV